MQAATESLKAEVEVQSAQVLGILACPIWMIRCFEPGDAKDAARTEPGIFRANPTQLRLCGLGLAQPKLHLDTSLQSS